MKRYWQHPEPDKTGRRYWRSLGEYENTPAHQERLGREFDPDLNHMSDEERESSRREFMKIMGGAAVLGGLTMTSCRRPLEKILPFTKHVEWIIPGKSLLYATVMPRPWGASPIVVTSHEGRPTHLQGNPLHPQGGGLDIFAQASVLELYNPDRLKDIRTRKNPGDTATKQRSAEIFDTVIQGFHKDLTGNQGDGLGILVNPTSSPTQLGLLKDFAKAFPKAKIYEYEPADPGNVAAAVKNVLGDGLQVVPRPAKADVVFSLDCDFVGLDTLADGSVHSFMARRAPKDGKDKMNRLYVMENRYTLTGGISDHRKPLAASLIPQAAALLAQEVGKLAGDAALQQAAAALAGGADPDLQKWIAPAAEDLVAHKGKALVLLGTRYDKAVHGLVLAINKALGALGPVIDVFKVEKPAVHTMDELLVDLHGKDIDTLFVMTETDPAYDAREFKPTVINSPAQVLTVSLRENHTTASCSQWTIPAAHYLETWGDARSSDGTYSIVQPMIAPLFGGYSVNDILLGLLGRKRLDPGFYQKQYADTLAKDPKALPQPDPTYDLVKATFTKIAGGWDEEKWNNTLRDGYLVHSAYSPIKVDAGFKSAGVTDSLGKYTAPKAPTSDAFEVVLTPDATLWDGRYVDNPWLQEAPDPITKLTWDNAAWMSPRTFRKLGLKKGEDINEIVEIKVGGKTLEIVAIECPGHAHDSITIPLGYGQEVTSAVGKNAGFNGYALRSAGDEFVLSGATVTPTGRNYELAITQDNYTMEGRAQVREGTKELFEKDETFAKTQGMDAHAPPNISLYQGPLGVRSPENPDGFDYKLHQWGMVIDLAKCIGCSACIVACQSENNIPIVGKDQVRRGRIMHWIRMDRYFATSGGVEDRNSAEEDELDNPEMVSQPVACQNCESAPCETVCPVNATIHTEEGLNAMAYNRCIGTRYCANNCPYTARRFNWFDYNKRNPLIETHVPVFGSVRNLYAGPLGELKPQEVIGMQKNPNVSVRMRGVIEKCTYCVQRLEEAKINQRRIAQDDPSKLRAPADSVKTACQASCPAEAIMFGDIANKDSSVVRWKANPRNYQVLQYIGTRPRTSYLARIRNVNPKMPVREGKIPTGESSMHNV